LYIDHVRLRLQFHSMAIISARWEKVLGFINISDDAI
jgi:hypothetical protein